MHHIDADRATLRNGLRHFPLGLDGHEPLAARDWLTVTFFTVSGTLRLLR